MGAGNREHRTEIGGQAERDFSRGGNGELTRRPEVRNGRGLLIMRPIILPTSRDCAASSGLSCNLG